MINRANLRKKTFSSSSLSSSSSKDAPNQPIDIKKPLSNSSKSNTNNLNISYPSSRLVNNVDNVNNVNNNLANIGPVKDTSRPDRMVCRFDYAPDLCKDYNETGYCGFGDSCIFLHDRGDYKSGWELDQEYNNQSLNHQTSFVISKATELPLVDEQPQIECRICGIEWETGTRVCKSKCGHEFCESCTLKKARKKCPICNQSNDDQFKFIKK